MQQVYDIRLVKPVSNIDFIGIEVTGNDRIARILARFPKEVGDAGADAIADYIIKVYRNYPPYKYVSRKRAYGRTFQSSRQRRYFFWALQQGIIRIGNYRTQRLRKGWKQVGEGQNSIIANEVPYSGYVMGSITQQANQPFLVGWKQFDTVYSDNQEKIDKVLFGAVKKQIKKMGLSVDS